MNYGADYNVTNERGYNIIHLIAGLSGQGEMTRAALQVFIQKNVKLIHKKSEFSETVLHMYSLNPAAIHVFVRNGVDINGKIQNFQNNFFSLNILLLV